MSEDLAAPLLPPLITGHPVAAAGDAFAAALTAVRAGAAGAGDLFWSEAVNRLDLALVLEPEVPVMRALQVHMAVMVALGDALGALGPPEMAVHYRWPSILLINGAEAGRVRSALSHTANGEDVPAYMVASARLNIHPDVAGEPGLSPETTSLWDEGCTDIDRTRLVESLARHFLTWIHTWETDGFAPVHEMWCGRAEGRNAEAPGNGDFAGLDEDGNLLATAGDTTTARLLVDEIERF